jgi:hypothetical protein
MKLTFTADNFFGEVYVCGGLTLCASGVKSIFGINAKTIRFDVRHDNPKKKGFKKLRFEGNKIYINKRAGFMLTMETRAFLENSRLTTFYVKCEDVL